MVLRREGAGPFVRDRLLRLGVPYTVGTVLLWPALGHALFRPLGCAALRRGRPAPDGPPREVDPHALLRLAVGGGGHELETRSRIAAASWSGACSGIQWVMPRSSTNR